MKEGRQEGREKKDSFGVARKEEKGKKGDNTAKTATYQGGGGRGKKGHLCRRRRLRRKKGGGKVEVKGKKGSRTSSAVDLREKEKENLPTVRRGEGRKKSEKG